MKYYHTQRPYQSMGNKLLLRLTDAEPIAHGEERLGGLLNTTAARRLDSLLHPAGPERGEIIKLRTGAVGVAVLRQLSVE